MTDPTPAAAGSEELGEERVEAFLHADDVSFGFVELPLLLDALRGRILSARAVLAELTKERDILLHGDDSIGDVIAAHADGTIVLDDGVTTHSYQRACAWLVASLASSAQEVARLRGALGEIAAWDDKGANDWLREKGNYSRFDEPGSVMTARRALSPAPTQEEPRG